MASALQFDLTTAYLDQPSFIAYGLVRGAGNLVFQQQLSDNSTLAFYVLGDGPWDSQVRLWINRKAIALPSANVHFHPGLDGEIGNGMAAASTGGDQHVDAFWSSVPGLTPVTYSRYAWLAVKVAPDPGAPSASLEVLGDYQAMRCRIFDAGGNQTAFQWTQNPAWWICDRIIRKFVLREGKVNQPLVAAELARFDWQSFSDAAAYYDVDIGGGIKRFSDGGVVFLDGSLTEDRLLEQLLLMCRSYILERNGKICLYPDQPRASVFTFTSDNIAPQSFVAKKSNLRGGKNRISASFREIGRASGSVDDATRFAIATQKLDHEAHQRAIGARGPGLSIIPKVKELQLDFGNNTAERVARLLQYQLVRQLGDDADPNLVYVAPFTPEWTGFEDSLKVEPGDVITIDPSISQEFGAKLYEVLEVEERPDGTRAFKGLEYEANAFTDVAPTQQLIEAPNPGNGLTLPNGVEMVRNPTLEFGDNGWTEETGFSIVSDSANAYAGSWVAKFVGAAAAAFRNVVLIAVQPGETLMVSCMAKRTAGDGTVRVRIDWLSAALAELSQSAGNAIASATYGTSRVVGAAPASAAFARVEAEVTGMTVSTTAYFDQFYAWMFPRHLGEVGDDDAGSGRRAIVVGSSTALNPQGNIPATALPSNWLNNYKKQVQGALWASAVYAVGDLVRFTVGGPTQRCIVGGTAGGAAPASPGSNWGTVTDGTVTWRRIGAGGSTGSYGMVKFDWAAFTPNRADSSTVSILASSTESVPAAPTLSQVAGGALAARTRYARVALVKNGFMHGISAEASLAVSVNNLLQVASPAAVTGYDGWVPLVGADSNQEQLAVDGAISIDAPIAFGTNYTEPAAGFESLALKPNLWSDDNGLVANQGIRRWAGTNTELAASGTYFYYPAWSLALSMVHFANVGLKSAGDPVSAAKQSGDGNIALSAGSVQVTQPAPGGTGSGTYGGSGGGRGTM